MAAGPTLFIGFISRAKECMLSGTCACNAALHCDTMMSSAPGDEQLERAAAEEHLPEGEHLVVVLRVHEQHLVGLRQASQS